VAGAFEVVGEKRFWQTVDALPGVAGLLRDAKPVQCLNRFHAGTGFRRAATDILRHRKQQSSQPPLRPQDHLGGVDLYGGCVPTLLQHCREAAGALPWRLPLGRRTFRLIGGPMTDSKELKRLVNASGFAFQLGIEHAVRQNQGEYGWDVVSREHPWHRRTLLRRTR